MKKLLLLALLLLPSSAWAQCNGVFANNTACGNISGSSGLPRAIPLSSFPANAPGGSAGNVQTNGGGGTFAGITNTQLTALINAFTSALSGAVPASGGGTVNYLRADGSWASPPGATSGTVTSISCGTGLTGGTITTSGTCSFASGTVIGSTSIAYTANSSLGTHIPADDTIPQNTEGNQIISASYTPRLSTSTLRVRFKGQVSSDSSGDSVTGAMFANSTANAFGAQLVYIPAANARVALAFEANFVPGSTSAQTINLRVGANTGNAALNGSPGGRILGGASVATMVIEEIAP